MGLRVANKTSEIVCCISCGRDTKNATQLCSACYSHGRSALREQLGRSARPSNVLSHNCYQGEDAKDILENLRDNQ